MVGLFCLVAAGLPLTAAPAALPDRFEQPAFSDWLPQRSALALLVDRSGGLWIATREGLARWDGHRMRYWRQQPFRADSLGGNVMRGLLEDRRGDIWAFNYTGLHRNTEPSRIAAPTYERVRRYAYPGAFAMLDPDGEVLLAQDGRLLRFDARHDRFRPLLEFSGDPATVSTALAEAGAVWIATTDGRLFHCDLDAASCAVVEAGDGSGKSRISHLWRDSQGRLWAGVVDEGLFEIESPERGLVALDDWPEAWRGALVRDVIAWQGRDLLVTSLGLIGRFGDDGSGCAEAVGPWCRQPVDRGDGLDDNILGAAVVDARGVLWLGSNWQLRFHDPRGDAFRHWLAGSDPAMEDGWIMSLTEDREGAIWAGSFRGRIYRIDPEDGRLALMLRLPNDPGQDEFRTAWDLLAFDDRIWIATSSGLIAFDSISGRLQEYRPPVSGSGGFILDAEITPDPDSIQAMARAPGGALWLGTNGSGLWRFEPSEGRFERPVFETPAWINHLLLDGEMLWLASANRGLHHLALDGGRQRVFRHDPGNPASLPSDAVWMVQSGRHGSVWIGTDSGLLKNEPEREGVASLHDGQDLPGVAAMSLTEDRSGDLWIGTNSGLIRFDTASGLARRFGPADGLEILEFNRKSALAASNGVLYFGGDRGIVSLRPERLESDQGPPDLHLESMITVLDENARVEYAGPDEALVVAPGTRQFGVRLASSELARPGRLRFQARIAGLEEPWRELGDSPEILFNRVPPGRYRLEARVADGGGQWTAQPLARPLHVQPAIWQTGWFRTLSALSVAGLLVLASVAWQRRRQLAHLQVLEQRRALAEERSRISRDMHDEVGTGLTEIVMLSEAARRGQIPTAEGQDSPLGSIAGRSRELLDSIASIIWALDPDNDRLDRLLAFLREATARQCEHAGCQATFDYPGASPPLEVKADFVRHLTLIVREAVSNAVRHSGAGCVTLRVELAPPGLILEVIDDGAGFEPARAGGFGNGLGNIRSRAAELGGTVAIESKLGAGTRVRLTVSMRMAYGAKE